MTPAARLVVSLVAVASFGDAIRAQPCDRFDVASIKVNTNGGGAATQSWVREADASSRQSVPDGAPHVCLRCSPLQVSGVPGALFQERYDIEATCEEP